MPEPDLLPPTNLSVLVEHILGNVVISLIACREDVSAPALTRQLNVMFRMETSMLRRSATIAAMLRVKSQCLR